MFTEIQLSTEAKMEIRCNQLMQRYNETLNLTIEQFRRQWSEFWGYGQSVEEMQLQLNTLSKTIVVDQGVTTNALSAYFAKARRLITFITVEYDQAFADARVEATGARQPNGDPYIEFLTPGWYYTLGEENKMIVTGPCIYS